MDFKIFSSKEEMYTILPHLECQFHLNTIFNIIFIKNYRDIWKKKHSFEVFKLFISKGHVNGI